MIGVASRNAKRAASSWSSPRIRPPTIVMPDRLMPGEQRADLGDADEDRLAVRQRVDAAGRPRTRRRRYAGADRARRRRSRSPTSRITPLIVRKIAAAVRLGEQRAQRVLEHQTDDAGRNRRDDEQHAQARVGRRDAALARAVEEAADDLDPVAAEVDEQRERGADVQRDEEREVERLVVRLRLDEVVPAEPAPGSRTEWPRLDTGNSSVTPWKRPMTIARKKVSTTR